MPAHRYVEEISSVAVTPEVNLREHATHTSQPSMNKAAHSGFETQRRNHQKSKTGVSVAPQKRLISSKIKKKNRNSLTQLRGVNGPLGSVHTERFRVSLTSATSKYEKCNC